MSNNNTPNQDAFTPTTDQNASQITPSGQSVTPRLANLEAGTPVLGDFMSPNSSRFTPLPNSVRARLTAPTPGRRLFTNDHSSPLSYPNTQGRVRTPITQPSPRMNISHTRLNLGSNETLNIETPVRSFNRGDINNPIGLSHSFNSTPNGDTPQTPFNFNLSSQVENNNSENQTQVIWGTTVNVHECIDQFNHILNHFKLSDYLKIVNLDYEEQDNELYFYKKREEMLQFGLFYLDLDVKFLFYLNEYKKLYFQLIKYPQEIIPLLDHCFTSFMTQNATDLDKPYRVRPYNLPNSINMRQLDPKDIDQLVSIKGLMIRTSTVIPDIKTAYFECKICRQHLLVNITKGVIIEPTKCINNECQTNNSMIMIHNRSLFADKQIGKIQETPDIIPDGQTPHSVSICFYDDLVDSCKPGDRLEITGIFRSIPVRVNPRQRTVKSLFKTYLDIVHVKLISNNNLQAIHTIENINQFSENDKQEIEAYAHSNDIYNRLATSLAPSIFGMEDVKKGILLQLFGGTSKYYRQTNIPLARGDMHILLIGDPGTSKSQMLQYAHRIAPRGIYTSGKGSSAVGLTAYITRDPDTNQLVLESGALVLSDGGICCIDEFDKMSDSTRSILHEVMEQQTVSVAKAGIITTLNARTSILACANPINSQWMRNLSVVENINLPPSLLSRFDLVYLILDTINENEDRKLAKHLVSLYLNNNNDTNLESGIIPTEVLTKYIAYAKTIQPEIQEDAAKELSRLYVDLRKSGQSNLRHETRITATTRQLESLIRLSEAHARMRLSTLVEIEDVSEAYRLLTEALKASATDPNSGQIDFDLLATGVGSHTRQFLKQVKSDFIEILNSFEEADNISYLDIFNQLKNIAANNDFTFVKRDLDMVLNDLERDNHISVASGPKGVKSIKRLFARGFTLPNSQL